MKGLQERRRYILEAMAKDGHVRVADLAEALGVTPTTIRKDLNVLEGRGLLYRAYGSALPTSNQVRDISLSTKKLINYEAKRRIGVEAARLIEENDSIIISSGSTMSVFADQIKPKGRLNVVSTSVSISAHLGELENVKVMQVGGILYSNTLSVFGIEANQALKNVFCSKLFLGIDGFSSEYGITCATLEEAELTRHMIKSASKVIVLSDSSKLGRRGFGRICGMDEVDIFISDTGLSDEARKAMEALGVKVITV